MKVTLELTHSKDYGWLLEAEFPGRNVSYSTLLTDPTSLLKVAIQDIAQAARDEKDHGQAEAQ